ncbi:MAG: B12-binding domain-containing radical SAM protein [Proteobacteria bacterium]|nr:B12-binding domain-containing radical SAM protein [Pseudomonadota bacterium]MBU1736936.1 B12-binding domain-containing radical SAM protein [Pseudomonadota bacterium]
MKCLLIIPAWQPEEIFPTRTAASQINYWQPLGTLYVASALQQAGHEVAFLNGAFLTRAEILNAVGLARPEFVGLYSTAFGWPKAMLAAQEIREILPEVFIAVGGPYPVAVREKCLEDCPDVDAVVTGEGEVTVVEMVNRFAAGRDLAEVAGLVWRLNDSIICNAPRPLCTNLDTLAFPARELLGEAGRYIPPPATYKRKPVAVVMTSRGCDHHCIYCFQMDRRRKSGIRYRSIDNVMAEIELCLSQGYREIKFIDETLAGDYDRAMQLTTEIHKRGLDFSWFASARVDQVDKPLLRAFKKAGCWAILLGAESGVQKNLDTIRKGITLEQIRGAVAAAREAGLKVFTPFLFGLPGETFAEGLRTIKFACDLNPDVANFHCLTPFPGTELHDRLEKYGTVSGNLGDYTYQGAAFTPFTMGRGDITRLRRIAFKSFYSRPRFLLRRFIGIRSVNDLRAAFTGIRSLFWIWLSEGVFQRRGVAGEKKPSSATITTGDIPSAGRGIVQG